jgi:hypothetical protein
MFADIYINYRAIIPTYDDFFNYDDAFIDDFGQFDDASFPTPSESFAPSGDPQNSATPFPSSITVSSFVPDGAVLCQGMEALDYCDCLADGDCFFNPDVRCPCTQAQACCGL